MNKSVHDKLKNTRKPRVHITYDVEGDSGTAKRELPFVVGVMGDYAGNKPGEPVKALKERKFINVDNDNIDDVMSKIKPGLEFHVEDVLSGNEGSNMGVSLDFRQMDDFRPESIVEQVEPLRQLLETRNKLRDLMTKVDRSEELEEILEKALQDQGALKKILDESSKEGV